MQKLFLPPPTPTQVFQGLLCSPSSTSCTTRSKSECSRAHHAVSTLTLPFSSEHLFADVQSMTADSSGQSERFCNESFRGGWQLTICTVQPYRIHTAHTFWTIPTVMLHKQKKVKKLQSAASTATGSNGQQVRILLIHYQTKQEKRLWCLRRVLVLSSGHISWSSCLMCSVSTVEIWSDHYVLHYFICVTVPHIRPSICSPLLLSTGHWVQLVFCVLKWPLFSS